MQRRLAIRLRDAGELVRAAQFPVVVDLAIADEARRPRMQRLVAERDRIAPALGALPLVARVWPSAANFLLVETRDAARFLAAGTRAGLLLRDFSAGRYTPGCVRVSVGTPEQNDRLLRSLASA
jgi:histidinol-phosphate/aromatic aminotransferase/cobyric acid decarboxylase-like protein